MSRILKISAALGVLGAIAGAVGGGLVLALGVIVFGAPMHSSLWSVAGVIMALGAGCGVLVAPVLSWTLLRNVPIWRSAMETALATSFAGIGALGFTGAEPWSVLAISALAATLAVVRLKWAFRRRQAAEPEIAA